MTKTQIELIILEKVDAEIVVLRLFVERRNPTKNEMPRLGIYTVACVAMEGSKRLVLIDNNNL